MWAQLQCFLFQASWVEDIHMWLLPKSKIWPASLISWYPCGMEAWYIGQRSSHSSNPSIPGYNRNSLLVFDSVLNLDWNPSCWRYEAIWLWDCKNFLELWACVAKVARSNTLVITLYPSVWSFGPGVLACATRGGGRSEAGHCFHLLFSSFFLFLFSFFFFSAFYFSPTSGNLPCVKICFPQYFGITRRYMQKKNIFFR